MITFTINMALTMYRNYSKGDDKYFNTPRQMSKQIIIFAMSALRRTYC